MLILSRAAARKTGKQARPCAHPANYFFAAAFLAAGFLAAAFFAAGFFAAAFFAAGFFAAAFLAAGFFAAAFFAAGFFAAAFLAAGFFAAAFLAAGFFAGVASAICDLPFVMDRNSFEFRQHLIAHFKPVREKIFSQPVHTRA